MATTYLPLCHICNKPVKLENAKTDDHGKTVHEVCYVMMTVLQAHPRDKHSN